MKPLVSVIIPIYNAAPFLKETLDSVMESTYRPIEVIMIDDGSKDSSLAIAQEYCSTNP
ncbi:MAG: glycosyltransferase family 2 protein, partial [Bacteroidales bacterium]|nr:glycosyltransferase family 2 protein [Bacteroidales bacterium]